MYWLTIGMFGTTLPLLAPLLLPVPPAPVPPPLPDTTPAPDLLADIEFDVDLVLVRPNEGELILLVVAAEAALDALLETVFDDALFGGERKFLKSIFTGGKGGNGQNLQFFTLKSVQQRRKLKAIGSSKVNFVEQTEKN
jgi:hypothetical protein